MKFDSIIAGLLFVGTAVYLMKRNLQNLLVWVILIYMIASYGFRISCTISMLLALVGLYVISVITRNTWEGFENDSDDEDEKPKKKEDPSPAPPKTDDPHVDIGTTILHAYRNLTPEQIGGMRRDTKELMSLQKELMGSLSEMKPAIEQGAELLRTFSTFFGDGQG